MRVQTIDGQIAIVLEDTGDISKMLLALFHSERSNLIPAKIIEALEDEMSE